MIEISGWFSIFVNSLKENDEDFTTAPIKYALPLLAIPMMINCQWKQFLQLLISFCFFSWNRYRRRSWYHDLITVLYAVSMGLGVTVTAMVSEGPARTKEKKLPKLRGKSLDKWCYFYFCCNNWILLCSRYAGTARSEQIGN